MREVVFGDSAKYAIMMAKSYKAIKKLEGEAQDVISLGFHLDIGDISGAIDDDKRKSEFIRLYSSVDFSSIEVENFFSVQKKDYELLIEYAHRGDSIRAWVTESASTLCGLAYLCDILRDITCDISVISRPDKDIMFEDNIDFFDDWSACPSGQFHLFTKYEQTLSEDERQSQSKIWQNLKFENALLRANNNGKLISVTEDYYDHLIIDCIPEGEFIMARLIGNILAKYPNGVHDGWYSLRINQMINNNILNVVSEGDLSHPYGKILVYNHQLCI